MTRLSRAAIWPPIWPLLLGLCFVTWLLGLACTLPYGVDRAVTRWDSLLNNQTLIALPPVLSAAHNAQTTNTATAEQITHIVNTTFPGTEAHTLSDHDVAATLAQWSPPWDGPLPRIIILHYKGDISSLTSVVQRYSSDATIIPPPPQIEAVAALMQHLRSAARLVAYMAGGAALFVIPALLYLGIRVTAHLNRVQQNLLPTLGGNITSLHHILAWRVGLVTFIGSASGLILLLPSLSLITSAFRPLLRLAPLSGANAFLSLHLFLSQNLLILLCTLPCIMAAIGWGMVHIICSLQAHSQARSPS